MPAYDPGAVAAAAAEMEFRELCRLDAGSAGVFWSAAGGPSPWEMHPDCDETLHVLAGEIAVEVLPLHSGAGVTTRVPAGSFFVVPRGCWHRQSLLARTTELYLTPGPSRTSTAPDPRLAITTTRLALRDGYAVTDIEPADKTAYLEHLADGAIARWITAIPFPYTEADADRWLAYVGTETAKQGRAVSWAIREPAGRLVGGIGFDGLRVGAAHRAELGYWLAKPLWGRGLMTQAVAAVSGHAVADLGLTRLTARVLDGNHTSARVLAKADFVLEGRLRRDVRKDDRDYDVLLYARLADRSAASSPRDTSGTPRTGS